MMIEMEFHRNNTQTINEDTNNMVNDDNIDDDFIQFVQQTR